MEFCSTRGTAPKLSFLDTVMAGLAKDGGLYVPDTIPNVQGKLEAWRGLTFQELFCEVASLFTHKDIPAADLEALAARSYATFTHPEITPVVSVGPYHVVELFHGPTLAFKDVALQFLGNLFEYSLAKTGDRLTVAGATSGDTGSAAIHALRGKAGVEVFILFPYGRVSPMQERQMTTVPDANIHALAVDGSFDDAQGIVKGLFGDHEFNAAYNLGAVNSINWARVMAQIVYFFYAYFRVVDSGDCTMGAPVRFSVPTGNFGHMFAGFLARAMGLPMERLIVATNSNDILHRFISTGEYAKGQVSQTLSPSMDIQLASNFERYLFELTGRDSGQIVSWMEQLTTAGGFSVNGDQLAQTQSDFLSSGVSDQETLATIKEVHQSTGYLLDPHSAIGYCAAQKNHDPNIPTICMATAHPAKFSDAIVQAVGQPPELPPPLAQLESLPTRVTRMEATLDGVREHIKATVGS